MRFRQIMSGCFVEGSVYCRFANVKDFHFLVPESTAMTTTLLRPSAILPEGISIQKVNGLTLFKFTEPLGIRMQELLDRKKSDTLTPDEALELETIGELDNIFSYINAVMAAENNGTA